MAIDDNTSYELTGAQVKDLANKIKAKAADNIFVGATSALPGSKGLVPQPQAGDDTKFLSGDGTWQTVSSGSSYTAGTGIDITSGVISVDNTVVQDKLTAGNHIDITNDVISAEGYVWADAPTASTTPAGSITNGMIANNTLTASKFATGVIPTITLSTTDIGEGAPLAANTLYGVYE